jgi:UDP-galactopyranose mutase
MPRDELLIIGAGPSGLAVSSRYKGRSRLLERSHEVGGLCRSVEFGGGVFDIGGHSFHSPHPQAHDLVAELMGDDWHEQRRDARVWFGGSLIPYPFQSHFQDLPDAEVVAECRRDLPQSGATVSTENFEAWLTSRFGSGIARHFLLPYNRKLWARELTGIVSDWVGERVAGAEQDRSAGGEPKRRPLLDGSRVGYPASGGFNQIYKALARRCGPIELSRAVVSIDPERRVVVTDDGAAWPYGRLVSTMPLPELTRAVESAPAELVHASDQLEFVSLKVLMLLAAGPVGDLPQRVYVADAEMPAHKIAFNHTSSPELAARPTHAIMCEIAHSEHKLVGEDHELAEASVAWLVRAGFLATPADALETRMVDVRYGYPVMTHDRTRIVGQLRAWLEARDIFSIGRFGAWSYVNSDACLVEGLALADRLQSEDATLAS